MTFGDSLGPPRTICLVTRYARSAALILLSATMLPGCAAVGSIAGDDDVHAAPSPVSAASHKTSTPTHSTRPNRSRPSKTPTKAPSKAPAKTTPSGPRVKLTVAQKPKCEEGTAVFRAKAVPLIIKWKITGATGAALSVDDPTNTPGTYGTVELEGSEEFFFTCAGDVGTVETHTYAIYSVGGGATRSKTVKVSAKVLDKGLGTNN